MFNQILQQSISPVQTVAAPSGTAAAAGAISSAFSLGEQFLKGSMEQEQEKAKAFVNEKVSTASLSFMDVFANASSRNSVAVQQRTDGLIRDFQERGYSNTEIAAAIKQANTLSGTSISSANKLERTEAAQALKEQNELNVSIAQLSPWITSDALNTDGTLPEDPEKLQAVLFQARAEQASLEARGLIARTRMSELGANQASREEQSVVQSQLTGTVLSGILRDSLNQFKNGDFTEEEIREGIINGREQMEKYINSDPTILPEHKANLLKGLQVSAVLLEDIATGKTNAELTTQQQMAKMEMVIAASLDNDEALLSQVMSSRLGLYVPQTSITAFPKSALKLFYVNPNKQKTNLPQEIKEGDVVPIQVSMVTPAKALKTEEDAASYIKLFVQAFTSDSIEEDVRMSRKDGAYLSFVDVLANKNNAENLSEFVLGNENVINAFMGASSKALGLYVSSVANLKTSGDILDTKRVKDSMRVVVTGKFPEVRIENPVKGKSQNVSPFSTASDESAYWKQAQDSVTFLNRTFRTQYEAALNFDRVAGTDLAGEIVNLQTQMLRQFIQE
jgi:hypothetical protein